jgi:hypothetical protein
MVIKAISLLSAIRIIRVVRAITVIGLLRLYLYNKLVRDFGVILLLSEVRGLFALFWLVGLF